MVVFYRGCQQDSALENFVDLDQQFSALVIHANAKAPGPKENRDVLLCVTNPNIIISLWLEAAVQNLMNIDYEMKTFFLFNLFHSENRGLYMAVSDYFCL